MHSCPRSLQDTDCPSQKELIKVVSVDEQQASRSEARDFMEQPYLPRPDLGNTSSVVMEKTHLFYFESDLKIFWLIGF